ncbi:MAG: hypothetical protein ACKPH4_31330 [Microcystis panniformis]
MPPYRTITSPEEPDFDTNLWGTLWYFIHDYNAQQSKGLSRHHYYRITTPFFSTQAKSMTHLANPFAALNPR